MHYKKTTLKNGLRIITAPMKDTQTATVMVMVGVGSRYEKESEAGISHFLEHMFFKGTKKRPSTLDISEELDAVGGEFNAFTFKDKTGYYAKVDSKHIETALDVVSDIYLNSIIDPKEIKKEKGTIIQELNMYEDTPFRTVWDVYEKLLYGENSLGRDVAGHKKTILAFKRKNFIDYMKRFYLSNDTVVCISGKFNEKIIIRKISKYFAGMKKSKKPQFKKVIENQKKPAARIKYKKTDQTHLILGNRAYDENHKDRFALALLSVILGGNMSSRLFIEVREKRGLAYSVHTTVESYKECGYIATQAGVDHNNLKLVIETILKEYKKIATKMITPKELLKAKEFIKGKSLMGLESSDEVAMFFIDQEVRKNNIMKIQEIFNHIDKVTIADILRIAGDIFISKKLNLAVIGPHKNEKELEKLLKL